METNNLSYTEKVKKIVHTFNQICRQDIDLFSTTNGPIYLRLSDISNWYPKIFNINNPVNQNTVDMMNHEVQTAVPAFSHMLQTHVLNTKENYSIIDSKDLTVKSIKNGPNQKLTQVICEHIFRHFNPVSYQNNTSIEQAYFLSKTKSLEDITSIAKNLETEQIRARISSNGKQLYFITSHAYAANENASKEIWSLLWRNFYKVQTMDDLRYITKIKTSPLDYMTIENLYFMNDVLENIIGRCNEKTYISIDNVKLIISSTANEARRCFINTSKITPEKALLKTSNKHAPEQAKKLREKFWQENYPLSLR